MVSGSQMTLGEYMPETFPDLTAGVLDSLARTSASPEKQAGFTGNRSSLFFRVMYLLGQLKEEEKPGWLFIENVKNLLSVNGGWDFARLLTSLDENRYDAEWCVLNSKDFGVPQNRERCFIIGHLRGRGGRDVFPVEPYDGKTAELQRREDYQRVVSGTLDTRIEGLTRGTYPAVDRGGTD